VLPTGPRWPDRGTGDEAELRRQVAWPVEGVLFDVENDRAWFDDRGPRPPSTEQALAEARTRLAGVPQPVPVYFHRYLPAGRTFAGIRC
jgi:hypothetical protein